MFYTAWCVFAKRRSERGKKCHAGTESDRNGSRLPITPHGPAIADLPCRGVGGKRRGLIFTPVHSLDNVHRSAYVYVGGSAAHDSENKENLPWAVNTEKARWLFLLSHSLPPTYWTQLNQLLLLINHAFSGSSFFFLFSSFLFLFNQSASSTVLCSFSCCFYSPRSVSFRRCCPPCYKN